MQSNIDGKAASSKETFRLETAVTINMHAKPERVWVILTNAQDTTKWNSTLISVSGTFALGETISFVTKAVPNRTFKTKVTEFAPPSKLVVSDGNFIFKGVRTYILTPKPDGTTDFSMQEIFTGLMLPLIKRSLPNFEPIFEQYASDLKAEAEKAN